MAAWDDGTHDERFMTPIQDAKAVKTYGTMSPMAQTYKIVVLGENGVGKTALVQQFTRGGYIYSSIPRTKDEVSFHTLQSIGPERMEIRGNILEIRDTGGHMQLRDDLPQMKQYVAEADGFLLCFSMNDRSTFDRIARQDLLRMVWCAFDGQPVPPILLCGCKGDRTGVTKEEVAALAKTLGLPYVITRAAAMETRHAFYDLASLIYDQKLKQKYGSDSPQKNKYICC